MVAKVAGVAQVGSMVHHWGIVDEGGRGGDDPGSSSEDCWASFPLLTLLRSFFFSSLSVGSFEGCKVSCGSFGNLRGQGGSHQRLGVEGGGNKRLRVESRGHGKTRILNPESSTIRDVLHMLRDSIGVNIGVSTSNSTVGIS